MRVWGRGPWICIPERSRNLFLKRQDGVVAVEFVILFPLFLLIIAGIVEFGHLFYVRHTLTNASREGARAAVVYTTDRPTGKLGQKRTGESRSGQVLGWIPSSGRHLYMVTSAVLEAHNRQSGHRDRHLAQRAPGCWIN